jgi:hypothetical protein
MPPTMGTAATLAVLVAALDSVGLAAVQGSAAVVPGDGDCPP